MMDATLRLLLMALVAFLSGALPFSVLLGNPVAGRDIR
jgi:glycerol-3-phosphate acyltransferase PlsY